MKDKNKKYIIVDAKNIKVTKRETKRVYGFNDFWNEYVPCGISTAAKIFKEHELPEQFHKIALTVPQLPGAHGGQEILTERPFYIYKNRKHKKYIGSEQGRWYDGDVVPCSLEFTTPLKKSTYKDVLNFYEQLTEEGYLETYIEAMKSIFFVENELCWNKQKTKLEDKAATLVKTNQNKKAG